MDSQQDVTLPVVLPPEAEVFTALFPYPRLMLQRGEGSWVWDVDGKRYLDFTSGLGVLALGHSHPDLVAALQRQAKQLQHCSNLFGNQPAVQLAQRLVQASFASRVWFANTGAEANEAALKFARLHGQQSKATESGKPRHAFVAFERGFHGRTMGALAVTATPSYREPFAPMVPGARFARFNDLASVEEVLSDEVCAIIVEPVQGEGGVWPAQPGFLHGLRKLCDARDMLLIFDEVQCGLGRTGRLFAYEHAGVVPDMVTLAKPLAGGLPLGATLVNDRVAALLKPGHHGSTFSGGPLACAVGVALFDAVSQPSFLQRVVAAGERLRRCLETVVAENPETFEGTRGLGLMLALRVRSESGMTPADLVQKARQQGLLVTRAGSDAVRLLPPLSCTDEEVDFAVEVLSRLPRV